MIHDLNNFLLSSMFHAVKNAGNTDDDIAGEIEYNGSQFEYNQGTILCLETKSKKSQKSNSNQKRVPINYANPNFINERIVLLLESPSNDEYIGPRFKPANGATGYRINRQLITLINNHLNICFPTLPNKGQKFDIVIMNSIRYQCDLGYTGNRNIINSVFDQLWNNKKDPFSADLIDRIEIISPILIINACSSINGCKLCSTSFLKNNMNFHVVETTQHPSRWSKKTIIF